MVVRPSAWQYRNLVLFLVPGSCVASSRWRWTCVDVAATGAVVQDEVVAYSVHFLNPCKSPHEHPKPGAGGTHTVESVALDAANESSGRSLPIDAGLLSDQHHVAIDATVAGGVPLMIPKCLRYESCSR